MVAPRTILALFALLLTATHCVDIDDRDLDVSDGNGDDDGTGGGGSTGDCAPGADDTDCTLCTKDNCCSEITTCNDNDECLYFADCWGDCLDDACVDYCVNLYPDGALDFADFLSCTADQCYDVCS